MPRNLRMTLKLIEMSAPALRFALRLEADKVHVESSAVPRERSHGSHLWMVRTVFYGCLFDIS